MHKSTMLRMEWFVDNYVIDGKKVLDVGSYDVNGSYKDLFQGKNIEYVGLDIEAGPNVDIVMKEPYLWSNIEDNSFDYIISGQAFEHIEYPWLTIQEIYKKLKPGGLICIIAPNSTLEHRYPFDCYRYFADGLKALAKWGGFDVLDVTVAGIPEKNVSPEWYNNHNDACLVAMKPKEGFSLEYVPKLKYERRYNGMVDLKLHYEFLAKWIEQNDCKIQLVDFLKKRNTKTVYLYGQEYISKVLYRDLKKQNTCSIELIGPDSLIGSETLTLNEFKDKYEQIKKDNSSIMLITLLDYCRDLKLYLDTAYEDIPKYYVDELVEYLQYKNFFEKYDQVYLYGAGKIGKIFSKFLEEYNLKASGFIVNDGRKKTAYINDLKVIELSEFDYNYKTGIIVTVSRKFQSEMEKILVQNGYRNYIIVQSLFLLMTESAQST